MNDSGDDRIPVDARLDMETVFIGMPSEVYVAQSVLRGLGFVTHLANENIKLLDPFVTGANPLELRLQVPREDAAEAYRALRELKGEAASGEPLLESSGEYDPELLASLDTLSRRIRWAAVSMVLAPVGAVLGFVYLARTLPLETKPGRHGLTLASIVLCVVVAFAMVASLLHSLLFMLG